MPLNRQDVIRISRTLNKLSGYRRTKRQPGREPQIFVTYQNKTRSLREWSEEFDLSYMTLLDRYHRMRQKKITIEQMFIPPTPIDKRQTGAKHKIVIKILSETELKAIYQRLKESGRLDSVPDTGIVEFDKGDKKVVQLYALDDGDKIVWGWKGTIVLE